MKVTKLNSTIELSEKEAYIIAYTMGEALKYSCHRHYKNHPKRVFDEQTDKKIKLMKKLFELSLFPHVFDSVIKECEVIIKEGNNE